MSVTKILCTRKILGSIATNCVRHHMSKGQASIQSFQRPSATYRLVHASRAVAPTQEEIEEAEVPVKQQIANLSLPQRRTEMDQRRMVRARTMENLQKMHNQKPPETQIRRLPFVKESFTGPAAVGKYSYRRYNNVDTLLQCTKDPEQLAKELVDMSRQLKLEKDKNTRLMNNYQDLLAQMSLKGK